MSLTAKNTLAFELLATKLVELHDEHGDLATLSTAAKATLVEAINEVKAVADSAAAGNVSIDDTGTSTTSVWSSDKTATEIAGQIAAALEGEDLSDLADAIAALQAADMGLVSANAPQTLTEAQKTQARSNIDAASTDDVNTNSTAISANTAAIGDESTYDPVGDINAILNF